MGNASASMQRERHKSSDVSTPNSPFRDMSGRDSVTTNVYGSAVGGAQHLGAHGAHGSSGGGAVGGAQAFTFVDTNKPADVSISHGSSQDDDEQPYYTKPIGVGKGNAGTGAYTGTSTGTATPTNNTTAAAAADNSASTTTAPTAAADPEFSEAAEPRKRSNTVSEDTTLRNTDSTMSAANAESTTDDQAAAASTSSALGRGTLPTVLRWDGGGKNVMISGTFTKWKPIPMSRSHGNFVTIIDLPEGDHEYKFCVDGEWKHDPKLITIDTDQGETNNLVSVRQSDFEVFQALAKDENTTNNAEKEYSQEVPQSKPWEKVSGPPFLPPHLLQVILNKDTPLSCEPTLLPEPNHVMVNHLYALSIKDGVMVLSATHRYRKKYVTTLLYKPI